MKINQNYNIIHLDRVIYVDEHTSKAQFDALNVQHINENMKIVYFVGADVDTIFQPNK